MKIRLAPSAETTRKWANRLIEIYAKRFKRLCPVWKMTWRIFLLHFLDLDARKISSFNMIERLNKEIRRRTNVIGIIPDEDFYINLVMTYLIK